MPWDHGWQPALHVPAKTSIFRQRLPRQSTCLALYGSLPAAQANVKRHLGQRNQQWSQLGCQVRKGEKATSVVFWESRWHRHQHSRRRPE